MDRRNLLIALLGTAAAAVLASQGAEAAPLPLAPPKPADQPRNEADFRPDVDGEAQIEQARVVVVRRRRRVVVVRRRVVVVRRRRPGVVVIRRRRRF
jgi:hypothetical protein